MHVEALDGSGSISVDADERVVTASTFKVFVALELFEQVAEGRLDAQARVAVEPTARTFGPTGLSCFSDTADLSLRDLAYMMLAFSDNAATDVLVERVGLDAINARLAALGLHDTAVPSDLAGVLQKIAAHVGFASYDELARAQLGELGAEAQARAMDVSLIPSCEVFDAPTTIHTTPRDMARFLGLIWRDDAGSWEACEHVRTLMALELGNRWREYFEPGVHVSTKGGSLAGLVRNQVGVVEYSEGDAYAVAIFTRADAPFERQHVIGRAIPEAAAVAVQSLRSG